MFFGMTKPAISGLSKRFEPAALFPRVLTQKLRAAYSRERRLLACHETQVRPLRRGGPGWARQRGTRMHRPPGGTSLLRTAFVAVLSLALAICLWAQAPSGQRSQPSSPPPQDSAKPALSQAPANDTETSIRDTPTTFKVRVNLVLVHVVVRNSEGKPVPNLKKEDFLLTDNRKLQVISTFSMETPATRVVKNVNVNPPPAGAEDAAAGGAVVSGMAQRFVAMAFDDVHMSLEDTSYVRASSERFLSKLAPSDRVAMYATSGQISQDFTNDRAL